MKTYKTQTKRYSLKSEKSDFLNVKITNSRDIADFSRNFYSDDICIYESFFIAFLNQQNNTVGFCKISQGGVTATVVDPLIVAKFVIESLSKNIILVHNHPSGSLTPSQADKTITNKIQEGLKMFDVRVLDHVILTENSFFSFADNNLM
jgi:DNA repair protein RadC